MPTITPHHKVIEMVGGWRQLANLLQLPPTTVQAWWRGGQIPAKHQQAVLVVARKSGIMIEPADFFYPVDSSCCGSRQEHL